MLTPHANKRLAFVIALLIVPAISPLPMRAQGQEISAAGFKFTAVDTKLLDEVNEVNRQLERKGFVLHDPEVGRLISRRLDAKWSPTSHPSRKSSSVFGSSVIPW